jgi:uncharacterized protein YegP (UPF0339 family)
MASFKIFIDEIGKFRFLLKSERNQIIFVSYGFSSKSICLKTICLFKKEVSDKFKFELLNTTFGCPYFNLKTSCGEMVGTSEHYLSHVTMENSIQSVKKNAKEAFVDSLLYSI